MSLSEISVDLRQMVIAIEMAVSLVGMNDTNHGKRVGFMALQMAHHLGFSKEEQGAVFDLGMLHDCGVSSDSVHRYLVNQFDWEGAGKHCRVGYELLRDFKPLQHLAIPILHHHTHWTELEDIDISFLDKRLANLIFLADRVDITAARFYGPEILLHRDTINKIVLRDNIGFFSPQLVEAFEAVSGPEAFWLALEDRHINRFVWSMAGEGNEEKLTVGDLKHLVRIFAYIVDQKSSFTARHSCNVAALARHLGFRMGLSPREMDKVEVAAYLHDVGKLHIPDKILEKPGSLTDVERSIISQHSYETYEILRGIKGLEDIALWAAYHHENCAGTGYPFHPTQSELPLPARIIAVSDVLQALVQDRPYRKGMGRDEAFGILEDMAAADQLDKAIVAVVFKDRDAFFRIAQNGEGEDDSEGGGCVSP